MIINAFRLIWWALTIIQKLSGPAAEIRAQSSPGGSEIRNQEEWDRIGFLNFENNCPFFREFKHSVSCCHTTTGRKLMVAGVDNELGNALVSAQLIRYKR